MTRLSEAMLKGLLLTAACTPNGSVEFSPSAADTAREDTSSSIFDSLDSGDTGAPDSSAGDDSGSSDGIIHREESNQSSLNNPTGCFLAVGGPTSAEGSTSYFPDSAALGPVDDRPRFFAAQAEFQLNEGISLEDLNHLDAFVVVANNDMLVEAAGFEVDSTGKMTISHTIPINALSDEALFGFGIVRSPEQGPCEYFPAIDSGWNQSFYSFYIVETADGFTLSGPHLQAQQMAPLYGWIAEEQAERVTKATPAPSL